MYRKYLAPTKRWVAQRPFVAVAISLFFLVPALLGAYLISNNHQSKAPLKVGIRHNPPYYFVQSNGAVAGLSVDVIEEATRRAAIPIRWVVIDINEPIDKALISGKIDIWPVTTIFPEPRPGLYITEPWLRSNYFLLSLQSSGIERSNDVAGRPVTYVMSRLETQMVHQVLGHARLQGVMSPQEALDAVCSGRADAAFLEARAGQALLLKRPAGCLSAALQFAPVESASLPMGIGSTRAAAPIADTLRSEIGKLAEDGTIDSIISRWSFITTKETQAVYSMLEARRRARWFVYGMILLVAALMGSIWQIRRVRHAKRGSENALRALQYSEESYRSLVENARDIVYTHDLNGNFTSLNKAGETITGFSRAEALHLNIDQVVAPEWLQTARQSIKNRLAGYASSPYEVEIVAKDGHRVSLEVNGRLIMKDGKPVAIQGIARDITERKSLEEQLRQAQKMEAVGNLAGGVAHDFNNLLTVMVGYCELLLTNTTSTTAEHKMIAEILKAAKQAASLTAQLLAFGRRQRLELLVLNLNDVIRGTQKMLRRLIGEHIELITDLDPALACTKADAGQIQQVIMNLAVNARDAMAGGGRLTIRTRNQDFEEGFSRGKMVITPGRYIVISVSDTGCGMDKETQARIFEPFFTTKEMGKGTGLGLSTVYGIVKQSGGHIWANSEPGQGTTFAVYLPRIDARPAADEIPPPVKVEAGVGTVLLVEDETDVRQLTRASLEAHGYQVIEAKDGLHALHAIQEANSPVDLLLTDVVMPVMTGPALARQLQRLRPGLKILFISGYSDNELLETSPPLQHSAFLQKPFTPQILASKVQEVMGRNGPS
jgi:PAS domain S-box-containing protein